MIERRFQWRVLQYAVVALIASLVGGAQAADRPAKPMRETATLPADKNILKRFGTIEDYLAEKRWTEAIDILQEIAQSDGRMLVQAQPGVADGSAVYVNVATRCNILLSKLPPEGLAAYRKKVDPQAKRWLDRWKQTRDDADLHRIVREAYLSSFGDDALWSLGESAWDRGDFSSAKLLWSQLFPFSPEARAANPPTVLGYPESEFDPATVFARLVLCTLMEGERDRAIMEQQLMRKLFPVAEGTLAGRQGVLVDLVGKIIDESVQWPAPGDDEVSTFALNVHRDGISSSSVEIGASKWSRPLPANRLPPLERPNLAPDPGPLSYHPVIYKDFVFVNNARSIWAWNLLTGEPAWPTERGTSEIYPPAPDERVSPPNQHCSGVPYYTMSIADGRLYARMGSPVTNATESESGNDTLDSDLVCLDLAHGQGKLLWKTAANELIKDNHKWRFEGSPLVMSGRAYVALSRRRPQFEFAIACMDSATGALLWHRNVVSARGTVEDHHNRVSHLLLTSGAGKIFLSTDVGAIVAVDANDGRLEWAVTYESVAPMRASSHLHQGLLPALFHEGFLFVAPNDCNRLFCIEADSGHVRWQLKQSEDRWRHLLGVVPGGDAGRLIVSGNMLTSIDIASRKIVFGRRSNPNRTEQGYGRGVIAGNVILWPTLESIKMVDATTGATTALKPLQSAGTAETGGNLTIAQGMLLVAQPERLVAYCEYSLLKQRLEKAISERSNTDGSSVNLFAFGGPQARSTESLLGQLSDVEYAQGNLDAAIATLHKAIDHPEVDEVSSSRHRQRLLELLRQAAHVAISEGHATVALERLTEARKLATAPNDIAPILLDMADAELAQSRPVVAVSCWQQILDDDQVREAHYRIQTAGAVAEAAISRLIHDRGRAVYMEVERRASDEIASLLQTKDLNNLHRILRRYPHATATGNAWRELATLERQAGNFNSALAIQSQLLDQSILPEERVVSLVERADTLEAAGYWRPARATWKTLTSDHFAATDVAFAGTKQAAGELARQRLSAPAYQLDEPKDQSGSRYLDRVWSVNGDRADSRSISVLVPRNEPPAASLACVLVRRTDTDQDTGLQWSCIDRTTGQVRWLRSLVANPQWVAYADSHLLLAVDDKLVGVSLESGRELWAAPLAGSATGSLQVVSENFQIEAPHEGTKARPVYVSQRDRWVLTFEPQTGVTAIDSLTGKVAWAFLPPRGKLQRQWSCGTRQIAVQTLQPSITWLLDIAADRHVTEVRGTTEPWMQGPMIDGIDGMVALSSDRRLECRSLLDGRRRWAFQGGMSFVHVDPVVWRFDQRLLLTIDGTTLTSVNPRNGSVDWSTGIAARPLMLPASQVIAATDAAFAASHGLLRRIALKSGDCQWERFLGSIAEQWQVTTCGALVAAWPMTSKADSGREGSFVVWCDARTGRILQRMNVPRDERVVEVIGDNLGWLVRTDRTLLAFHPADSSREVVANQP